MFDNLKNRQKDRQTDRRTDRQTYRWKIICMCGTGNCKRQGCHVWDYLR